VYPYRQHTICAGTAGATAAGEIRTLMNGQNGKTIATNKTRLYPLAHFGEADRSLMIDS